MGIDDEALLILALIPSWSYHFPLKIVFSEAKSSSQNMGR